MRGYAVLCMPDGASDFERLSADDPALALPEIQDAAELVRERPRIEYVVLNIGEARYMVIPLDPLAESFGGISHACKPAAETDARAESIEPAIAA